MESQASRLDGNALAGMLGEIFAQEMTTARVACGGCGQIEPIGAEHVYLRAAGAVVRCRHCEGVLLVITATRDSHFVGFAGRWMQLPRSPSGA